MRSKILTIGARQGSFPGVVASRTFSIVGVSPDRPTPVDFGKAPAQSVTYAGQALTVQLK